MANYDNLDAAVISWDYKQHKGPPNFTALVVLWLRAAAIKCDLDENGRVYCEIAHDFFMPNRPTMKGWCEEMDRVGKLQVMYAGLDEMGRKL